MSISYTPIWRILNAYLKRSETDMSHEQLAQVASEGRVSQLKLLTEAEMMYLSQLLSNLEYKLHLVREVKQVALSMAYIDPNHNRLIKDAEISKLAAKHGISERSLCDMYIDELEPLLRLMKKKKSNLMKRVATEAMKATVAMLKELNIETSPSPKKNKV